MYIKKKTRILREISWRIVGRISVRVSRDFGQQTGEIGLLDILRILIEIIGNMPDFIFRKNQRISKESLETYSIEFVKETYIELTIKMPRSISRKIFRCSRENFKIYVWILFWIFFLLNPHRNSPDSFSWKTRNVLKILLRFCLEFCIFFAMYMEVTK